MFRRVLTAAAAAAAVALAAGLPVPAHAAGGSGCVAAATPPYADPARPGVHASGTFGCGAESFNLYVEVCVEELHPGTDPFWTTLGCSGAVLNDGGTAVTAEVTVAEPERTAVLRATVTGVNERGDTASGTSAPVIWPHCGCA